MCDDDPASSQLSNNSSFDQLPPELLRRIGEHLPDEDLRRACQVSWRFRQTFADNDCWRSRWQRRAFRIERVGYADDAMLDDDPAAGRHLNLRHCCAALSALERSTARHRRIYAPFFHRHRRRFDDPSRDFVTPRIRAYRHGDALVCSMQGNVVVRPLSTRNSKLDRISERRFPDPFGNRTIRFGQEVSEFAIDRNRLLAATADGGLYSVDLADPTSTSPPTLIRKRLHESDIHTLDAAACHSCCDEGTTLLLSGSRDHTAQLSSVVTGTSELRRHFMLDFRERVWCARFCPSDVERFAIGSAGSSRGAAGSTTLYTYQGGPESVGIETTVSTTRSSDRATLNVFSSRTGQPVVALRHQRLRGSITGIKDCCWHDSQQLLSGGWEAVARLWDCRSAQCTLAFFDPADVTVFCVASDGANAILTGGNTFNLVRLWDARHGKMPLYSMRLSSNVERQAARHRHRHRYARRAPISAVYASVLTPEGLYVGLHDGIYCVRLGASSNCEWNGGIGDDLADADVRVYFEDAYETLLICP